MSLFLLSVVLFFSCVAYVLLTSYEFQIIWRRNRAKRQFIDVLIPEVKGSYQKEAYFASSHHIIQAKELNSLSSHHKAGFTKCYNVVTFKTVDANWELFFYLIKEGMTFKEVLTIRSFVKNKRIRSDGTAERSHSRVNILTNNRYLTGILEGAEVKELLRWILKNTGDSLHIYHNNLHYRALQTGTPMTYERCMEIVKGMHKIKNRVYRDGVLEY